MKNKKLCICGCGRTFTDLSASHVRVYFEKACYPSQQKVEFIPEDKVCICGCGGEFSTTSTTTNRIYANKAKCRQRYLAKIGKVKNPVGERMPTSKKSDLSFRHTVCRGFNKDGSGRFRGICENYSNCSDRVVTGELWEFELNGFGCYCQN